MHVLQLIVRWQSRYVQVFPDNRPVALAEVDCVGNETSLLDCPSRLNPDAVFTRGQCGNSSDATILACGDSESGVPHSLTWNA